MSKVKDRFTETVKLSKGILISAFPFWFCKKGTVIRVTKEEKKYLIKNKMAVEFKPKKIK